eukprot:scaffold7392_cov388-Prasinococcus_capsulatus_cf.AAC.6
MRAESRTGRARRTAAGVVVSRAGRAAVRRCREASCALRCWARPAVRSGRGSRQRAPWSAATAATIAGWFCSNELARSRRQQRAPGAPKVAQRSSLPGTRPARAHGLHSLAAVRGTLGQMFGIQRVQDAMERKAMMQREVQVALNVARARDTLQWWGTLYGAFITTVSLAKLTGWLCSLAVVAGRNVSGFLAIPAIMGGFSLANIADLAYGSKLNRVVKETEHILENERSRLVPPHQAPFHRFYTDEEKAAWPHGSAQATGRQRYLIAGSFLTDCVPATLRKLVAYNTASLQTAVASASSG